MCDNQKISSLTPNDLAQDLDQFWRVRQVRIYARDLSSCSEDYKNVERGMMDNYELLKQLLTEDQGRELLLLVHAGSAMEIISNSIFYKQGFMDGLKFINGLSVVRQRFSLKTPKNNIIKTMETK